MVRDIRREAAADGDRGRRVEVLCHQLVDLVLGNTNRRRVVAAEHLHAQRDGHQLRQRHQGHRHDDHGDQYLDERKAAIVRRLQR